MSRLTKSAEGTDSFYVETSELKNYKEGLYGEAINKLAKFENFYDELISKQIEIPKELEKLRLVGKSKSVKFKQLLVDKITNNNILIMLKRFDL